MKHKIVNNIIDLIGQTPLVKLNRLTDPAIHADVYGKLEAKNPGGSIKDRACLNMIEEAERAGIIMEGSTIIEPTSGNTGIGLAMICAVKGYKCILTMPEAMSLERIYLLRLYGAEVVLTPARDGIPGAIKKAEELAKKMPHSFIPRQFDNASNPNAHKKTTAIEIMDAFDGEPIDAFVAGVGTGGTISGTGEILKANMPDVQVIAVEPKRSAVLQGKQPGHHTIQGIGSGFVPQNFNRDVVDDIMGVDDKDAFDMMRQLGAQEGLCVGISAGANVWAALQVAKKLGPGKKVVTILCDTGERYFTVEQYYKA